MIESWSSVKQMAMSGVTPNMSDEEIRYVYHFQLFL